MMAANAAPLPFRTSATRSSSGRRERSRSTLTGCISDLLSSSVKSADSGQELVTSGRVISERAQHAARDHGHPMLPHASRGHAGVARPNHHSNAPRVEDLRDRVRDLGREPLLDLEPARISLDHPRQLRDADHPVVRKVAHMGDAFDSGYVVLAAGLEWDVPQYNHLVVTTDLLEGPL